jgi:hypothetical protein
MIPTAHMTTINAIQIVSATRSFSHSCLSTETHSEVVDHEHDREEAEEQERRSDHGQPNPADP